MREFWASKVFRRLTGRSHRPPDPFYIPVIASHIGSDRHSTFVVGIKTRDLAMSPDVPCASVVIKTHTKALQVSADYVKALRQPVTVSLRLRRTGEFLDRPPDPPHLVFDHTGHEVWEA